MINVNEVTKTFGTFKSLDRLSLNVKKGSVYGLVGPNGAGKTTIIKNIVGIYIPDSGEIKIDNMPVFENTDLKDKVIYIGDDLYFFPSYSILDMAKFYSSIYSRWDWDRFNNLKEFFKIDVNRKARRLSKGMQKQVAFWLGISARPDVMVLDEPVDGLDPVMRKNVWRIVLQDVAERDMTVLVSSHNLRELEDVCDHVGIMHEGRVVLEKELDDVKGNIHKIQLAFKDGFPEGLRDTIDILHSENVGCVHMVIVRGDGDAIKAKISKYEPMICDIIPLTLEEVFIYELGGMGYEFEKIIL